MEQFFEDYLKLKREPSSGLLHSIYIKCCNNFPPSDNLWATVATNSLTTTIEFEVAEEIGHHCSVRFQLHLQRVMSKVDCKASVWFRSSEGRLDVRDLPLKVDIIIKKMVASLVKKYLSKVSENSDEVKTSISSFYMDLSELIDTHFEGALGDEEEYERRDAIYNFVRDKIVGKDAAIKSLTEKLRKQFKFIFEEEL